MKTKTITASLLFTMMLGLQNVSGQIQQTQTVQTTQSQQTQNPSSSDGEMRCVKKGDFNISLKLGYLTVYDLDNSFSNGGTPISLELGYAVSDHVIIGIEAGEFKLQTPTTNIPAVVIYPYYNTYYPDTISAAYSYYYSYSVIYYMADLQWHWLNEKSISLYSGLAVGSSSVSSTLVIESGNPTETSQPSINALTYQLTALGFRAMGKHVGVHLELGYGIMGITSGGFDLKF